MDAFGLHLQDIQGARRFSKEKEKSLGIQLEQGRRADKLLRLHHSMPGETRRQHRTNGTPYPVGSGPAGETCRTCRHLCRVNGRYLKCKLMQRFWTGGPGTDIRAKWSACKAWEQRQE